MDDPTSLSFGLDGFRVVDVVRVADRVVQVVVEAVEQQGICPQCGAASARVKERPLVRIRDLPPRSSTESQFDGNRGAPGRLSTTHP